MLNQWNRREMILGTVATGAVSLPGGVMANDSGQIHPDELRMVSSRLGKERTFNIPDMPASFGAPEESKRLWPSLRYGNCIEITIDYLTDADRLIRYLPKPFEFEGDPVVSVLYGNYRDVDWLA